MNEYKQVAALLCLEIDKMGLMFDMLQTNKEWEEQFKMFIEFKDKITTDPEFRQEQYELSQTLINLIQRESRNE